MQRNIQTIVMLSVTSLNICLLVGCDSKEKVVDHTRHTSASVDIHLNDLLKPTNEFVISNVPVTTLQTDIVDVVTEALGTVAYDTREIGVISSRVSGRIERLYVHYRFQRITAGQKIMDIYSPELLTYQENLLFLLNNDADNVAMIEATKERLLVNGMSQNQLADIIRTRLPSHIVSIYSKYTGHVHDATAPAMRMQSTPTDMKPSVRTTEALNLREGMYVEKGRPVLEVYNPDKVWILLQVYADKQGSIKRGDKVVIIPEAAPTQQLNGNIDYIEPIFRTQNKTLSARVYFDNARLRLPVGSQVRAVVNSGSKTIQWLPEEAVVSLGRENVVFRKVGNGFIAQQIFTGSQHGRRVEVTSGLKGSDTVAANGQYFMDSESFIKVRE